MLADFEAPELSQVVRETRAPWEEKFARAIADYLAIICLGEARHGAREGPGTFRGFGSERYIPHRGAVYRKASRFDPCEICLRTAELFAGQWNPQFGGLSWARIARHAGVYWSREARNTTLWLDKALNLAHNHGLCFDKTTTIFTEAYLAQLRGFFRHRREAAPEFAVSAAVATQFGGGYDIAPSTSGYWYGGPWGREFLAVWEVCAAVGPRFWGDARALYDWAVRQYEMGWRPTLLDEDDVTAYVPVTWLGEPLPEIVAAPGASAAVAEEFSGTEIDMVGDDDGEEEEEEDETASTYQVPCMVLGNYEVYEAR